MSDLPDLPTGWAWSTVGEVGSLQLGRQRSPKWHNGPNMRPYLRVKNIYADRVDLSDVMEMESPPEHFEKYKLEPGDILLCEGQSPEFVGRPAMYRGELPGVCFTNSLIRFRPHEGIHRSFALHCFLHLMYSGRFQKEARITTNIAHLSASRLSSVEFPVPPTNEQQRIVDAIEAHMSSLQAAVASSSSADQRLERFTDAVLESAYDKDWTRVPLDTVNESDRPICYGILKPKTPEPGEIPYVEVRSITNGRINVDSLHLTTRALHDEFRRSELRPGDVALAIRGSYDRAAVVPDALAGANVSRDVARIAPLERLHPQFLASFLVSPEARRYFRTHARGVAVQGINIGDLRKLPVPCPSLPDQHAALVRIQDALTSIERIKQEIRTARKRGAALRRSVLDVAFVGQLVPQDPSDEPATALLERIRVEKPSKTPRSEKKVSP